jgi:dolichyl-phosphate-mannose-protein mannosyltransferase
MDLFSFPGQQVTGYPNEDNNNHWQIIPTKSLPDTGRGRLVRNNDVFRLLHVPTQTYLLTHDVASPLMPTNQEFTTLEKTDQTRYNDTLFQLHLLNGEDGDVFKSKSGYFKLYHVPTKAALWSHPEILPEWAFGQQEVNGDRKALDMPSTWWVQQVIADECMS